MPGPCTHQYRGGEGEPLVLIHGIGSSWRVWKPVIKRLEQRHEVLAVSLPGYGDSPPLDEEPTVPALTGAVERELDAIGWDTPHIVGNSMGGWITAELAARGRARSGVAIDPAGLFTPKELHYSRRSLRRSYKLARLAAPIADRITANRVGRTLAFGQVQSRGWRNDLEESAYAIRALANSPSFLKTIDWIERNHAMPVGLDQIDCPFLVVWGTWDLLLPVRQAKRWERIVPGCEVQLLPRLGHVPMGDDPETVAGVIEEFVSRAKRSREPRAAAPA
jgi:pimeloyl-ACP methyl ester carboxylesterase